MYKLIISFLSFSLSIYNFFCTVVHVCTCVALSMNIRGEVEGEGRGWVYIKLSPVRLPLSVLESVSELSKCSH